MKKVFDCQKRNKRKYNFNESAFQSLKLNNGQQFDFFWLAERSNISVQKTRRKWEKFSETVAFFFREAHLAGNIFPEVQKF
jgi:hypothetical protein